jgi:hypothetical protein
VIRRLVSVLSALALAVLLARAAVSAEPAGVRFRGIQEGFGEARTRAKPLLLFIPADWCAPCHELEREVFGVSHFASLIEGQFVPVRVVVRRREDGRNVPEVEALLDRAGGARFPTLLVLNPDGLTAVRLVGWSSRKATLTFLREAVQRLGAAERKLLKKPR